MKLIDALEILNRQPPEGADPMTVSLVCGFTPLHFETFLAAHLRMQFPDRRVQIRTGLYGDFTGNLERMDQVDAAAIVMEWPDLDPRLGFRRLGGWAARDLPDILRSTEAQLDRIRSAIGRTEAKGGLPLAISLPTLPLPPVAFTPGWQASSFELELRARVAAFGAWAAGKTHVRIVSEQALDRLSPYTERFDLKSEVLSGFPYKRSHAAALADLFAKLIRNHVPKKGLITDLDDTLWSGILGEVGVEGIAWDLDHQAHIHGLYQQLLHSLAGAGVLVAVASKNDASAVEEAFRSANPILPAERIFPFEVHWGRKSESVTRILNAWNISADSVVFVDDSALDVAEVKRAHPEIECLQFPRGKYEAACELLQTLRDLFGKSAIGEEDAIRLESIRKRGSAAQAASAGSAESADSFLQQADAEVTVSFTKDPPDPRALELVNKTNQFNLNGRRYTEASWREHLRRPGAFLMVAAYRDKYGPLGKIAAISGHEKGEALHVEVWVMSCRAFSRRIEHRCMEQLFERFGAREITLDFAATPKNGPLCEFLATFLNGRVAPGARIPRDLFLERCPPLFQQVKEIARG